MRNGIVRITGIDVGVSKKRTLVKNFCYSVNSSAVKAYLTNFVEPFMRIIFTDSAKQTNSWLPY